MHRHRVTVVFPVRPLQPPTPRALRRQIVMRLGNVFEARTRRCHAMRRHYARPSRLLRRSPSGTTVTNKTYARYVGGQVGGGKRVVTVRWFGTGLELRWNALRATCARLGRDLGAQTVTSRSSSATTVTPMRMRLMQSEAT